MGAKHRTGQGPAAFGGLAPFAARPLGRSSSKLARTEPFFAQDITSLARALIGATLLVDGVGGRIVETEAYDAEDPASHSFGGRTARNASMFDAAGCAYVYRIYGAHWCLNIVGGREPGAAVLVRALAPTHGLEIMRARRGVADARRLCAGPGRLCQALGVGAAHDGLPIEQAPFSLARAPDTPPLVAGPRIGVTRAAQTPWRFGENGSIFLSRPFRATAIRHRTGEAD